VLGAVLLATIVGLARFLVSGAPRSQAEGMLLSWPVGYANAFAALAAIALPIAISASARAERVELRVTAAAAAPLFIALLVLTSSRGGAVAAVVGLACLGALDTGRRALASTALRLAPGAAVALAVCFTADPTGATTHLGLRRAVVAAGLGAASLLAGLAVRRRVTGTQGRRLPGRLAAAAVIVGVGVAVALTAVGGVDSQRDEYWRIARQVVAAHPALGAGAGSFGPEWFARAPVERYGGALDAHNLYLETLAELGPVGLVLLLVFLALPLTRARTDAVAAAAYIAFLVHALLDWDWEMPAVTLAAVLLGGTLLLPQRGRALSERERYALAAAAVVLALAALLGLRSGAVPGATAGEPAAAALRAR
jgi:hypothetical protein